MRMVWWREVGGFDHDLGGRTGEIWRLARCRGKREGGESKVTPGWTAGSTCDWVTGRWRAQVVMVRLSPQGGTQVEMTTRQAVSTGAQQIGQEVIYLYPVVG